MGGYIGIESTLTPVEYIESSGTQYIDTGVIPTNTFKVEIQFARKDLTRTDGICGSYNNTTWGLYFYPASNGKYGCAYGTQNVYIVNNTNYQDTDKHTVILNLTSSGLQTTVDNTVIGTTTYSSIENNLNFYIFRCNDGVGSRNASIKLYSFKIYNNNELVRDFIPVVDENNMACLYDSVGNSIYFNKGYGTFTAGSATGEPSIVVQKAREIRKIYAGVTSTYTPVEYLESSGTQYIDTGIYPNSSIHCYIDFQMSSIPTSSEIVAGAWEGSKGMLFGVHVANGLTNFEFAFGTSAWGGNTQTADTNRHTVYMNDENGDGRLDNTVLASHTNVSSLTNTTYKIYLFRCNGSVTYYSKCKIYSCKIYDGSTLVRDYVPALDDNNIACLFDLVNSKAYYNKGAGIFAAGNATGEPNIVVQKARKVIRGYVGVNGVARLFFKSSSTKVTRLDTTLTYPRYGGLASTTDYIVYAGGHNSGNTMATTSEWFDENGTKTTGSSLSTKRICLAPAYFNGNAFFCGGATSSTSSWTSNTSNVVEYFTNNKVRTTGTSLSYYNYGASATANGTYHLLVCGGDTSSGYSNVVNFFNTSLTRTASTMSTTRTNPHTAVLNGSTLVAGGKNSSPVSNVDSFSSSGTRTSLTALSVNRTSAFCTSTSDYFFVAGGSSTSNTSGALATVDVYNKSFVRSTANNLTAATMCGYASNINGTSALFPLSLTALDIYDNNLVKTTMESTHNTFEWGGYGRTATSTINGLMMFCNQTGEISMVQQN